MMEMCIITIIILLKNEGKIMGNKKPMSYPSIKPTRLSGSEPITTESGKQVSDLNSFWSWAYSNIMDNAERGALAEYLVACALGVADNVRVNWDKYDLLSSEGIAVEVKSSGYLQSWD